MKVSFIVAVFLAVFVAVSMGGKIRRQAPDNPFLPDSISPGHPIVCRNNKRENCVEPYLQQYSFDLRDLQETSNFLKNRSNVEQWAQATETAQTCLEKERSEPYCLGVIQQQTYDVEIEFYAGYLTTPGNIDILVNLTNSQCFSSTQRILNIERNSFVCLEGLYTVEGGPGADPCEVVDGARNCLVHITSYWCGPEAGDFVGSVWDYLVHTDIGRSFIEDTPIPAYVVEGCYQQANVVKRFTRALMDKMHR